ncbi:MAG: energy transducer TonB [Sphingobacteriia bacterium]|nr:energy transducer TonB [Sphingobacteriia bacterium]NCC38364.1 energy transducer TonB [Gammaproteobacteria bacterium]
MGSLAQEPELPAVLEARPAALTTNDMTQARPDERLPAASVGMPAAPEHTAPTLDATSALAPSSHASAPAAPEVIPWPPDPSQDTARPAAQDPDTPAITRLDDLLLSTPGAEPTQAPPRERQVDVASILDSRGAEIDRLANAARSPTAGTLERPRRETVSTSTPDLRYASYLGAWTRKVERIGSLNYPQAAREQRLYGSLILHVAVRADGSLEQVRILRSSGYDLLDEAAIRIVELAAPFAPFPPDIAAETDVLDIVRAWQFMKGGRLGWEH